VVDPLEEIEELVAFEGRWAGTDAERRAALHLRERLERLGRESRIEPTSVYPSYAAAHAIHALLAIVGSVLSVSAPIAGVALVLVAAISTFGDLTGSFLLVRRLTGRRASQNVVSQEDGERPGTLVLVAHYDAARTGLVFSPAAARRRAALGRLIRRDIGPFEPFFWSIVAILACTGARLFDVESLALTIVQFVPTVLLIVSVPLLVDITLSGVVPGANDNASGVATVLRLAETYGDDLDHFDLWVLFTGAEEGLLLGMREWLRAHRSELDPRATIFLNVDKVGTGTPRYARKEGFVVAAPFHPALLSLCDEVAEDHAARPFVSRAAVTDAHAARLRGYPALSVSCLDELGTTPHYHQPTDTPDRIDPEALELAYEFCADVIELIDERIGPGL
jgi:hypothetical protein